MSLTYIKINIQRERWGVVSICRSGGRKRVSDKDGSRVGWGTKIEKKRLVGRKKGGGTATSRA